MLLFLLKVWTECGRARSESYSSDTGKKVFAKCPTDKPVRFSCGNSSGPQFTSNEIPSLNFKTSSCIKFDKGALNPHSNDYILSIDNARNPNCGQYVTTYSIYMHFGTQWGCNGTTDTDEKTGWWFSVSYQEIEGGKLLIIQEGTRFLIHYSLYLNFHIFISLLQFLIFQ